MNLENPAVGIEQTAALKSLLGSIHIYIGLVTIFISLFMLFFVFHSLNQLAQSCTIEPKEICEQFTGLTHSMIVVLLIISGLVITTMSTIYIILSQKGFD